MLAHRSQQISLEKPQHTVRRLGGQGPSPHGHRRRQGAAPSVIFDFRFWIADFGLLIGRSSSVSSRFPTVGLMSIISPSGESVDGRLTVVPQSKIANPKSKIAKLCPLVLNKLSC